jgi:hypothetical protein
MSHHRTWNRWSSLVLVALLALLLGIGPSVAADKKADTPTADSKAQGAKTIARKVDRIIARHLQDDKTPASGRAQDAEFLRRAYLDLTGVIPPGDKAAAFLDSQDPDKRAKLIDELLASSNYGKHLSDIWQALLIPRNSDNRRLQSEPFVKWLEETFNANKPWDRMIHELVTASGEQDKNGAVTLFLANSSVDKMTDVTTKAFLGLQLQCAQCHDHPFTKWKQKEYWGMAAFFMKVQPGNIRAAQQNNTSPGVTEGNQPRRGRNAVPESAKIVPAKFLQGEEPKLNQRDPYRPVLADWMTSPKNPYFAKAIVNRVWAQLFGRGIVNPVDDMHEGNVPSHPEVLNLLAEQFVAGGYDLKNLYRTLCLTETYQRTSKPVEGNKDAAPALFSRMAIKVMTGEQLYDSLVLVNGAQRGGPPAGRPNAPPGRGPGNPRANFVAFFNLEDGADPTEYQSGIPQTLRLMNSAQTNNSQLVNEVSRGSSEPNKAIEKLYLSTLARRPSAQETEKMLAHVQKTGDNRKAYSDILWVLINTSEFTLNH